MSLHNNSFRKKVLKICFFIMMGFLIVFSGPLVVSAAPTVLDELTERIEGSPMQVFEILINSFENGATQLELNWNTVSQNETPWTNWDNTLLNDTEWSNWDDFWQEMFVDRSFLMDSSESAIEFWNNIRGSYDDDLEYILSGMVWGSPYIDESGKFFFKFYSNQQEQSYGLIIELNDNWTNFDLEVYVDREQAAARTQYANDNFFGFYFDTFANDLLIFFNGLYEHEIIPALPHMSEVDELARHVRELEYFLNSDILNSFDIMDYMDLLLIAFLQAEQTSEQVVIRTGGRSIATERATFTVDLNVIFELLIGITDRMENNANFRMGSLFFENLRRDILAEMDTMSGTIAISLYRGRTGRLFRIGIEMDYTERRYTTTWIDLSEDSLNREWRREPRYDDAITTITIDFGTSPLDTWALEIVNISGAWGEDVIRLKWKVEEYQDAVTHKFIFTEYPVLNWHWSDVVYDEIYNDETLIEVTWDRSNNEFTLYYSYKSRWGSTESASFSGTLAISDSGFTLQISELIEDLLFNFKLSAEAGAPVPSPEFINLDRWIYYFSEVEHLTSLLDDFLFRLWRWGWISSDWIIG